MSLLFSNVKGQQSLNLVDEPIFVSANAQVQLKFSSKIISAEYIEPDASLSYDFKWDNSRQPYLLIFLLAKKNIGTQHIIVTEGKNTHRFLVSYKEDLEFAEISHDYSDGSKLVQEVKRLNAIAQQKVAAAANNTTPPQTVGTKNGINNPQTQQVQATGNKKQNTDNVNYYDYFRQIDDALKTDNFDDAMTAYGKAKQLNPTDDVLDLKLKKINDQRDSRYSDLMTKANTSYNDKKYAEAAENYSKAALIKKEELMPKRMLARIDADIKENNKKIEEQQQADIYNNAMKVADDYLKNKQFENARAGYKNVLTIRERDPIATYKLGQIDQQIADDKKAQEKQRNDDLYSSSIKVADDEFNKGALEDAKDTYTQILKINGHQEDVTASLRIKQINKQLDDNKREGERKANDALYNSYIKNGNSYFDASLFDDAKIEYGKALSLKGGADFTASQKIKETEKKIKQKQFEEEAAKDKKGKEEAYASAIKSADIAYQNRDYNIAKAGYQKAITLGDDKYPLEQISKISELDKAEKIRQQNEQKTTQETQAYNDAIEKADKAFIAKDYDIAKYNYNKASIIKPNEQYIKDRLNEIQKAKDQQDADNKQASNYKTALNKAAQLYKNNDLTNARKAYMDAEAIKADEKEPYEKVAEIESKLQQNAEKKAAQETQNYIDAIDKADKAFIAKEYETAKLNYNKASDIKPNDQYPKDKLNDIQKAKDQQEADRIQASNYKVALDKAAKFYKNSDFANAKKAYLDAATIKTNEKEPIEKIAEIDERLKQIAQQNALNDKYDSVLSIASQAISNASEIKDLLAKQNMYEKALAAYMQAADIRPKEGVAKKNAEFVKNEILNIKAEQAHADSIAFVREQERKYKDASDRGEEAKREKKWDEALAAFNEVLLIRPEDNYAQAVSNNIRATMKREADEKQSTTATAKTPKQTAVPTVPTNQQNDQAPALVAVTHAKPAAPTATVSKTESDISDKTEPTLELQENAIPYTEAELKKYFGAAIDFHYAPPGLPIDGGSVGNNAQNALICNQLTNEKPRFVQKDSINLIKLICEGISFRNGNMYVKLLVENYGNSPFPVGPMLISWYKGNGSKSTLVPGIITSFPVIMPQKAFCIIYVTKNKNIASEDGLYVELGDRLKKTKLSLTILGDSYKKEKER